MKKLIALLCLCSIASFGAVGIVDGDVAIIPNVATAADLATKLALTNITPAVTSETDTVPSNKAVKDKSVSLSVKEFGAVGDGVSDDTSAFNLALTNRSVFVPSGTYSLSNITVSAGTVFYGEGQSSILSFRTNRTGYALTTSDGCTIRNLKLDGNVSVPASSGCTAILFDGEADSVIDGTLILNFNQYGITVTGNSNISTRLNRYRVSNNTISDCYGGILLSGTNKAEYGIVANNHIRATGDGYGMLCQVANVEITGNVLSDNYRGIYVWPNNGRGHVNITGNTVNHSRFTSVYVKDVSTGCLVANNNILGNAASVLVGIGNSSNVIFSGNFFEGGSYVFEGKNNVFRDNYIIGEITTTFAQDSAYTGWNNFLNSPTNSVLNGVVSTNVFISGTETNTIIRNSNGGIIRWVVE